MAGVTPTEEDLVAAVNGFRDQMSNSTSDLSAQTEAKCRQMLQARSDLEAAIAANPDDYLSMYGDAATPGDTAETVAAEIAKINSDVDSVISITGRTRQELEAELT